MSDRKLPPLLPFVLTIFIILADQITKAIIVRTIPVHEFGPSIIGDFIRFFHTRNHGVAFSIGANFPAVVRRLIFILIPLCVMVVVIVYYIRDADLTKGMRWALAGILGGGIGNLIDRIFRADGVVDFIYMRVYGFLGMEVWPIYNVADSSTVISGSLLILLFLLQERRRRREERYEQKG